MSILRSYLRSIEASRLLLLSLSLAVRPELPPFPLCVELPSELCLSPPVVLPPEMHQSTDGPSVPVS